MSLCSASGCVSKRALPRLFLFVLPNDAYSEEVRSGYEKQVMRRSDRLSVLLSILMKCTVKFLSFAKKTSQVRKPTYIGQEAKGDLERQNVSSDM